MGAHGLTAFIKERAREQARANGGVSSFLQTNADYVRQLETIQRVRGPSRKIVIIDLIPLLYEVHRALSLKQSADWLKQQDVTELWSSLDQADAAWVAERREKFKKVLGQETVFIYIVDGKNRPKAKEEELVERQRRAGQRRKKEKPLPSGIKPDDIRSIVDGLRPWMQSEGSNVRFIEAHDEADWLIAHILTQSCVPPRHPPPLHSLYDTPAINEAIELLEKFHPMDRITETRDTDDLALLTEFERGWCLLSSWQGKLDAISLQVPHSTQPRAASSTQSATTAAPPSPSTTRPGPAAMTSSTTATAASAPTAPTAPAPTAPAALATGSAPTATPRVAPPPPPPTPTPFTSPPSASPPPGSQRAHSSAPPSHSIKKQRTMAARLHLPPTKTASAGPTLPARLATVERLPTEEGNSILVYGPGLDALPGFGSDREQRIRAWALAGNDYLRHAIPGFGRTLLASGLVDALFKEVWTPNRLRDDINAYLTRLTSSSTADVSWRGTGRSGRIDKASVVSIGDETIDRLYEAYRIARGEQVEYIDRTALLSASLLGQDLDQAPVPPRMTRDTDPSRQGREAQKPQHPYIGRPDHATDPNAVGPSSATDPRLQNPLHSRPRHLGKAPPNKLHIRPRAAGPSVAVAAWEIEQHEVGEMSTQQYLEAKARKEQKEKQEAERQARKKTIEEEREQEKANREATGDDEHEIREGRQTLPSLESVYQVAMSHGIALKASLRFLSAHPAPATTRRPPPEQAPNGNPDTKSRKNRSGARQAAAERRRLTNAPSLPMPMRTRSPRAEVRRPSAPTPARPFTSSPASSPLPASASTTPLGPPPPSSAPPPATVPVPEGVANIYGLMRLYIIAGHLAVRFGQRVILHLFVERLEDGQRGAWEISREVIERNGLARLGGRVVAQAAGAVKGTRTAALTTQEELAIAAVLGTGAVPPPRGPASLYNQLFVSYQTSVAAVPTNWLIKDLRRLGKLLGADPSKPVPYALTLVVRSEHRSYAFAKSSTTLLAAAAINADSASRFGSALGKAMADILVEAPFTFESAAAGTAKLAETGLKSGHRASTRTAARKNTTASLARQAGLVGQQREGGSSVENDPAVVPETETDFAKGLAGQLLTALSAAIQEYATAISEALQASGAPPLPESAADDLEADLLRALFRLVANRNRLVEISINLCEPRNPKACQGKTLEALMKGGAPINTENFVKGLIALTMITRKMQGLSDEELLPTYDPSWIPGTILELVRLAGPAYLPSFIADMEVLVTDMARHILPRLDGVDGERAAIFGGVRDLFDIYRVNGDRWTWREAEVAGASGNGKAVVTSVRLRLKDELRRQAEALLPTLAEVFNVDPGTGMASWVERNHAKLELVNLLCRLDLCPRNFVPTGFFHANTTRIHFYGVKTNRAYAHVMAEYPGLDAGALWSEIVQRQFSQIVLDQYAPQLQPAYEWRWEGVNGSEWQSSRIEPIS